MSEWVAWEIGSSDAILLSDVYLKDPNTYKNIFLMALKILTLMSMISRKMRLYIYLLLYKMQSDI